MTAPAVEPNPRVTFRVAHEDEHVLVVEKPARLVTNPGVGHEHDTLLNGLFHSHGALLRQLGKERDFGLVHRLDRETSGLLAIALTIPAYDGLRAAFAGRHVRKFYWAIAAKAPRETEGVIRHPILEEVRRTGKYTSEKTAKVSREGKPALTAYRVLDISEYAALIEARPVTGRLHQVRVHLAAVGAPILGDEVYGPQRTSEAAPRVALHAHRLAFTHPVTGEELDLATKTPRDLRPVLKRLELATP